MEENSGLNQGTPLTEEELAEAKSSEQLLQMANQNKELFSRVCALRALVNRQNHQLKMAQEEIVRLRAVDAVVSSEE